MKGLFLFQTGAIKSETEPHLQQQNPQRFYSKLVRLKVNTPVAVLTEPPVFLFQTGAIKRNHQHRPHRARQ